MKVNRIKVLVVDDSPFMRKAMAELLRSVDSIEVTGFARNGAEALEMIERERPDVVTLDIEMPVMDGLETLRRIMNDKNPVPSLMVSTATTRGADITLTALEEGAIDFITKPSSIIGMGIDLLKKELIEKITTAAGTIPSVRSMAAVKRAAVAMPPARKRSVEVILIGISTGGPTALLELLPRFRDDLCVAIVIAQHMPPGFSKPLAERLNRSSSIEIKEAAHGDIITAGRALIARSGMHIKFIKQFDKKVVQLVSEPRGERHSPSVDVMFESAAHVFSGNAIPIIMTGMGNDGVRGLAVLKGQGAFSMAQSEKTCTIYGMPKAAGEAGMIDRVVDLQDMAKAVMEEI